MDYTQEIIRIIKRELSNRNPDSYRYIMFSFNFNGIDIPDDIDEVQKNIETENSTSRIMETENFYGRLFQFITHRKCQKNNNGLEVLIHYVVNPHGIEAIKRGKMVFVED